MQDFDLSHKLMTKLADLAATCQQPLIIVENPKFTAFQQLLAAGKPVMEIDEELRFAVRFLVNIGNATTILPSFYPDDLIEAYSHLNAQLFFERNKNVQSNQQSNDNTANPG